MWLFVLGLALGFATLGLAFLTYYRLQRGRKKPAEEPLQHTLGLAQAGRLAGGLAHEIKNPLSTINLNLQLLHEDFAAAQSLKEQRATKRIEVMEKEVSRLQETLNDFLRYIRKQKPDKTPHDINRILDEVLDFVAPQAAKHNINVLRSFSPDLGPVMVDENLMKQAFLNIILNAHQAMLEGGEFMARTTPIKKGVRIELTDTGVGIEGAQLDKIFEAYYSTKGNGSGLGLAMTKRIVEEHRGTISVQSEPRKGTRFVIELPYQ